MKTRNIIIAGLLLFGACVLTLWVGSRVTGVKKNPVNAEMDLDKSIAEAITRDSFFETENTNLVQGGLVAFSENKIYFADITNGGVLSVSNIGQEENSHALTDFPVANISVRDDKILFTDITGTYYMGFDEEGNEEIRIPEEAYMMTMYLADQGLEEELCWGGNLYYAEIGSYTEDASLVTLEGTEISRDGIYYSPRLTQEKDVIALYIPQETYLSYGISNVLLVSTDSFMPPFEAETNQSFMDYLKKGIANMRDTVMILRPGEQPTGNEWVREIPNIERKDGEMLVTNGRIELFGDGYFALELAVVNKKTLEWENKIAFYNLQDKNKDNYYEQLSTIEGGRDLVVKDGQMFYLNQQGDIMRHDPEQGTEPLLAGQNVQKMILNGNGDFELTLPVLDKAGKEHMMPAVMKEGTWVESPILSDLEGERGIYYTIPGQKKGDMPFFTNPMESRKGAYTIIADLNLVKKLLSNNIAYYGDADPMSDVYYRYQKLTQTTEKGEYEGIGFVIERNDNYDPKDPLGGEPLILMTEEELLAAKEEAKEKKEEKKEEKEKKAAQEKGANPYFPGLPYTPSDSYYFYPEEGKENTFIVSIRSPGMYLPEYSGWFLMGAELTEVFENKDKEGYFFVENESDLMQWDADGKNCKIIRKVSFLDSYAADNMQKLLEEGSSGITYHTASEKKRQLEDCEYIRAGNIIYYCYEMSGYDKPWTDGPILEHTFLKDLSRSLYAMSYESVEESLNIYRAYAPNSFQDEILAYGVFADRELYDLFSKGYDGFFSWYYSDKPGEITVSSASENTETVRDGNEDMPEDENGTTKQPDKENETDLKDNTNLEKEPQSPWTLVKSIIFEGKEYPGPIQNDNSGRGGETTVSDFEDKKEEEEEEEEEKVHTGFTDEKLSIDPDGKIDGDDYIWDLTFGDLDPELPELFLYTASYKMCIDREAKNIFYSDAQIETFWANRARGILISDKFTEEELLLLAGIAACSEGKDENGDLSERVAVDEIEDELLSCYLYRSNWHRDRMHYKFFEDGTYTYVSDATDLETRHEGTYSLEGNILRMHREGLDNVTEYFIYLKPMYDSQTGKLKSDQISLWMQDPESLSIISLYYGFK